MPYRCGDGDNIKNYRGFYSFPMLTDPTEQRSYIQVLYMNYSRNFTLFNADAPSPLINDQRITLNRSVHQIAKSINI